MENHVSVKALSKKYEDLEKGVFLSSKKVLKHLERKNLVLEVLIVSDARIKTLNSKFRGKNKSTNVLSFELKNWPAFVSEQKTFRSIGEVYIAPDYIHRKKESLERMLTHGILHLLGYDHQKKGDSIRMENLEKKVFRRFGF